MVSNGRSSCCGVKREIKTLLAALSVILFLQNCLDNDCTPSTIKVYGVGISVVHLPIDCCSVEKHKLVAGFLKGARQLHPSYPNLGDVLGA